MKRLQIDFFNKKIIKKKTINCKKKKGQKERMREVNN